MNLINITSKINQKDTMRQIIHNSNEYEIILNYMNKGSPLLSHNHEYCQVGFCYEGSFLFNVNQKQYIMTKDSSYFIPGFVQHGAEIIEDIITLDYKFCLQKKEKTENEFDLLKDILVQNADYFSSICSRTTILKIPPFKNASIDMKDNIFILLAHKNGKIKFNGDIFNYDEGIFLLEDKIKDKISFVNLNNYDLLCIIQ